MANVWFVERVGAVWRRIAAQPEFQRPLGELIFKLDLGPQRRQADAAEPDDGTSSGVTPHAKTFVEVTPEDLEGALFPGYFAGWYDSPYSAAEVTRRLG